MQSKKYIAAIVQHPPAFLDLERCLQLAETLIAEAAQAGARLVVFSESWLCGYPIWIYGAAAWDDPRAKTLYRQLAENALEVPGAALARLCRAAAHNRTYVVMGATERDVQFSRGTLYNSLVFISDTGQLLGVHRKLIPTHAERLIWGQGDGSTLIAHATTIGRLGGLICWEHWMPLPRFALHAAGEQVHIAAWPMVPEMDLIASRHYAHEGRCFVLCAGQLLRKNDIPHDFPMPDAIPALGDFGGAEGTIIPGGSAIIGPDGMLIADPATDQETIVYGEIDLGRVIEEQMALDSAGHYHRPDLFQVELRHQRRVPIEITTSPSKQDLEQLPNSYPPSTDEILSVTHELKNMF